MISLLKIKFDQEAISLLSLFERVTRAHVKDCIMQEGLVIFIVNEHEMGKAVGKSGANVRALEANLRKKVKVIEYSPDLAKFVAHVIAPNQAREIIEEQGIVTIIPKDPHSRGYLIGRNATILRLNESIVKRYFDITEIKVAAA